MIKTILDSIVSTNLIWLIVATVVVIVIINNLSIIRVLDDVFSILLIKNKLNDAEELEELLKALGVRYDEKQDIFQYERDVWQKSYGYSRIYDEAAPFLSMIIDCEPIYFQYDNKRWLIEFWKGQYFMYTGGEVGIYYTVKNDFNDDIGNEFIAYDAVKEEDYVRTKFSLSKDGKELFNIKDKSWWITGFLLGEYSEPEDLKMTIEITIKYKEMRKAFLGGLKNVGYLDEEIEVRGNTVKINFIKPHTKQPYTSNKYFTRLIRRKNERFCKQYKLLSDSTLNSFDNLVRLKKVESNMFKKILVLLGRR